MKLFFVVFSATLVVSIYGDVSHLHGEHLHHHHHDDSGDLLQVPLAHHHKEVPSTPPPPPKPYAFGYAAGRFPGHIDRTHSEVGDGSGAIKGSYSYVDPRNRIRTVDYTADQHGFYPVLSHTQRPIPNDSPVVAKAKEHHYELYAAIANSHAAGGANQGIVAPNDSVAVAKAKQRHNDLFHKIAEQHAIIAAEREAIQATAEPNLIEEHHLEQH